MKTKLTILLLLISIFTIKAQERTTIAFLSMSYDEESVSKSESRIIQETVLNGFVSSRKFIVVDREKLEDLEKEKSLQRTEAFLDSEVTVTSGLNKGASYLVDGSIMSVRNSEIKKDTWECNISIQIRMLDVSTGEILSTETVNSDYIPTSDVIKKVMKPYYSKDEMKLFEAKEDRLQAKSKSSQEAFSLALMRLSENLTKFTSSLFPITAEIVSWDPKKRDEFVLGAGSAAGIQNGQVVDIVKSSTISIGEKQIQRNEVLGSAWIIRVDDKNFSVATLVDNQKAVKIAIKDGHQLGVLIR